MKALTHLSADTLQLPSSLHGVLVELKAAQAAVRSD